MCFVSRAIAPRLPWEKWLVLLPNKWNPTKAVVYGWRWDPRELSPDATAPVRDERRRGARCMED